MQQHDFTGPDFSTLRELQKLYCVSQDVLRVLLWETYGISRCQGTISNLIHEVWQPEDLSEKFFRVFLDECQRREALWNDVVKADETKDEILARKKFYERLNRQFDHRIQSIPPETHNRGRPKGKKKAPAPITVYLKSCSLKSYAKEKNKRLFLEKEPTV